MSFGLPGTSPLAPPPGAHAAPHVAHTEGRRVVLGACLEDAQDGFDERPFAPTLDPSQLPPGIDLRRWMTPVEAQGDLGGCSASALASAAEYLVSRVTGRAVDVSRMFIYFNQRLWRNRVREDSGGSIQDGVRVLARIGVPDERSWPYHLDLFAVQPPVEVYRAAAAFRIDDYAQVPVDLAAMRGCLASGFPIALPVQVFESCRRVTPDGGVPSPTLGERHEGLHAVLVVGYVDAERLFIVRNSWGAQWGDGGYGYFPYDYLTNREWVRAGWALRGANNVRFDVAEHVQPDLRRVPKAPPAAAPAPVQEGAAGLIGALGQLRGGASGWQLALGLATQHSSKLISTYTGNAAIGEVVGGLVGGYGPQLLEKVRGLDGGVLCGPDLAQTILDALRAPPVPPTGGERPAWADGLDEEAVVHRSGFVPAPAQPAPTASAPAPVQPLDGAQQAPVFGAVPALFGGAVAAVVPAAVPPSSSEAPAFGVVPAMFAGAPPPASPSPPEGAQPAPARPARPATQAMSAVPERGHAGGTQALPVMPDMTRVAPPSAPPDPARARWELLGGAASALGRAADSASVLSDGVGRWLACERGAVVFHPAYGAWEIVGPVFEAWSRMGSHLGPMGYPVVAESVVERDGRRARIARFERGVILDWEGPPHADLPPFALLCGDALVDEWVRAGAEGSACGLPLGVPRTSPDGALRWLPCERGGIVWDPHRGAYQVAGPEAERWVRERLGGAHPA